MLTVSQTEYIQPVQPDYICQSLFIKIQILFRILLFVVFLTNLISSREVFSKLMRAWIYFHVI